MQVKISLEYFVRPGESVSLVFSEGKVLPMTLVLGGVWSASFEVPASGKTLEYSFEILSEGICVRSEWRDHKLTIPSGNKKREVEIRDRWSDRPDDQPFWSKAFSEVFFRRKKGGVENSGNVVFVIPSARIRRGEVLALTGSGELFDEWHKFLPMTVVTHPFWSLFLSVKEPFEYKFVILDTATGVPKAWEKGPNHFFAEVPSEDSTIVIRNLIPAFDTETWRGAGTAIPVFSLRSKDSFGVGEFNDLKKLADWASETGQSVIQVLPVNDTTMTGTWTDSYPYNANSTFALHPQFIHLPDAGVKVDKEYKALQKELEELPAVDYEKVNNEKKRLLKAAFKSSGHKVLSGDSYKKFYAANEYWLLPYAVFCVLRDINGTADFTQWKDFSVYDSRKVSKFFSQHKNDTAFYCFEQYCLDSQLKEAVEYAHSKGVAIKGDLPIGISRTSVDAWQWPKLFNLDSQAGAPPDAFSAEGQNWGFPTYNWDEMSKNGYAWWKSRLGKMSEYFDAFRIDHILGFFRIWEIPMGQKSGLMGHFSPALPYSADEIRGRGFDPNSELFVPDPHLAGWYHPRIAAQETESYKALSEPSRRAYNALYDDFFFRRHEQFWKNSAMKKLPALLDSTRMLSCGEDLGMIPACVPETMEELRILSLEIQRMPKSVEKTFGETYSYPYMSVCATGTHDTSTIRGWWEEDRTLSARFFHEILHCAGEAPYFCEPWVCELIVRQHLGSPSMFCILPLQDWISIDESVRYPGNPADERINIPADPHHYWRWRMYITLEDLLSRKEFNGKLRNLVKEAGRG